MAKSRDAFRTISEVSTALDTPTHVLRFWESKFSQIKPVKRAGGRRYYRPDDISLLSGIKQLLHEQGMTIKGAQKLLRENGVKHVIALSTVDHIFAEKPPKKHTKSTSEPAENTQKNPTTVAQSKPNLTITNVVQLSPATPTIDTAKKTSIPAKSRYFTAIDREKARGNADRIQPLIAQLTAVRDRMLATV